MKKTVSPQNLSLLCACSGVVCFILRLWLLTGSVDEKGLLVTSHPGNILCWVLTGVITVLLILSLWGQKGRCIFPPQKWNALGMLLRALAFAILALWGFGNEPLLCRLTAIAAIPSALCALFVAYNRTQGRRTHVLLSLPAVVCLVLLLLSRYQVWSAEPELQRYLFPLVSLVCIMMASYQHIAAQLGMGSSFIYLLFGCGGIYFCLGAAAGPDRPLFFLLMGMWLLMDIATMTLRPSRQAQG